MQVIRASDPTRRAAGSAADPSRIRTSRSAVGPSGVEGPGDLGFAVHGAAEPFDEVASQGRLQVRHEARK